MAVTRIETSIVLGIAGVFVAGGVYVAMELSRTPSVTAPEASPAQGTGTVTLHPPYIPIPSPVPVPFVATAENESSWRPDVLPSAWPRFAKLPSERPLASKSTKAKIEGAKSIMSRWQAFKDDKAKSYPADAEAAEALDYLLTIDRNDPGFPEAWALFIELRKDAKDISSFRAQTAADEAERRQAEIEKREAKHHGVNIGMTEAQVLGSNWGRPQSINTTITAGGRHEQWVYGGFNYLYFKDGILTSIQTGH